MNHDQFLANNDHSSPCILQNHPALWQLNPSLWPELLKSWYWWVLVSREAKVTKGWMHRLPGLVPGKGEVEPDTEHWVFFLFGFMKGAQVGQMLHWQHGSLQRMEGGPAKGLCKYTERKGDKFLSADHMCACDCGLRRSPYTLVDTLWAATHLKAVSVQLCIQLLSKSGEGTATLWWWPLFLTCLSSVPCSAAVVMADLREKCTGWLTEHRNCHFAVPTEIHTASGRRNFTNNPSVKTLIAPAPRKWKAGHRAAELTINQHGKKSSLESLKAFLIVCLFSAEVTNS